MYSCRGFLTSLLQIDGLERPIAEKARRNIYPTRNEGVTEVLTQVVLVEVNAMAKLSKYRLASPVQTRTPWPSPS